MLQLDRLLATLPVRPDNEELIASFVPPARFSSKSFENYTPLHPTQSVAHDRLQAEAAALHRRPGMLQRLGLRPRRLGGGIYLDGGFGVGKTHLLAAIWNAAPPPKSYLTFDELVYFIGLVGVSEARAAFTDRSLVAIDEWELDDPGNLKLALAFLRGAVKDGVRIVVTSNTLPLELGAGRFSQKDFAAEIEELATRFEVVRVEGEDYRHRHFEAHPGVSSFLPPSALERRAAAVGDRALLVGFADLTRGLSLLHPIRYAGLVDRLDGLFVRRLESLQRLPDALRWVHFVDALYDSATPFGASSQVPLGDLFPASFLSGPYEKKISRCLSRMEELLGESVAAETRPVESRRRSG